MRSILFNLFMGITLYAEDIIVERMQSVVDEVTQLRKQFEISQEQYALCQEKLLLKCPNDTAVCEENSKLEVVEQENESLKSAHESFKVRLKELEQLESDIAALKKENLRLDSSAKILVEKNHTLLKQLNDYKRTSPSVKSKPSPLEERLVQLTEENKKLSIAMDEVIEKKKRLENANEVLKAQVAKTNHDIQNAKTTLKECESGLTASSQSTSVQVLPAKTQECPPCVQRKTNVFPKLIDKNAPIPRPSAHKSVEVKIAEPDISPTVHKKGSAYRLKEESPVYSDPRGGIVEIWEAKTSFTSNVTWGEWIKITGYFVDQKWIKADRPLWIKESRTLKR